MTKIRPEGRGAQIGFAGGAVEPGGATLELELGGVRQPGGEGRQWRALLAALLVAPVALTFLFTAAASVIYGLEASLRPDGPTGAEAARLGITAFVLMESETTFWMLLNGLYAITVFGATPVALSLWALKFRSWSAFAVGALVLGAMIALYSKATTGDLPPGRVLISTILAIILLETVCWIAHKLSGGRVA